MSAFQKTVLGLLALMVCGIFTTLGIVAIAVIRDTRTVATIEQQATEVIEEQNATLTPMPTPTPPPTVNLPERANPTPTNTPVVPATPFLQPTPSPTPHSGPYQDIATLVYDIAGVSAEEIGLYEGPDGCKGYDVDIPVTYASERTREEILGLAYDLTYAYYYNFSEQPYFIMLHLRPTGYPLCNFGLGIGFRAATQYLPQSRPQNLESWFAQLVAARYYGDEPGQTDDWLAYANDAKNRPLCQLSNLQK